MLVSTKLQPLRGIVGLDGLALYDYGGVTAFDAAGGRGDGAGDVAARQHHRQPDSQRRQQGQEDLFDLLFHCSSFYRVNNYRPLLSIFFI